MSDDEVVATYDPRGSWFFTRPTKKRALSRSEFDRYMVFISYRGKNKQQVKLAKWWSWTIKGGTKMAFVLRVKIMK